MQQQLKSEVTRQIILDSAFTLFYESGFKTTSIEKIMANAKLSKGAFYHHYKNKKELGVEVIGIKLQKRVYEGMIRPLYETGNAIEILESTFLQRIKSFAPYEKQHGCPINNLINEIGDYETAYQIALKNIIEQWKSALTSLIERGKTENTIKQNIHSQAVATYLISAFEGVRGIRKLYNDDVILEEYMSGLSMYIRQLNK
ncbi:TetR/AcrR family transcriptional regulator [Reichenbachiella agarivorans]|uniref:TetR/AcrR family transcriptional regulator n=1 Tax=Reichenbachiella agarivorans TaxID=2979464 RepID=A0ABY6CL10_9BACT|nr:MULTISPECIES: TetR/AcrR family transcriptional regulator [Reichenbachiella]RJE74353.1 TetR family transcriptional regulator [Reichenbachiella sp. MSK19-1]UXP31203.1 TetR/AcrR family transcriptional regulator [Reichenbachiella agarivorans]